MKIITRAKHVLAHVLAIATFGTLVTSCGGDKLDAKGFSTTVNSGVDHCEFEVTGGDGVTVRLKDENGDPYPPPPAIHLPFPTVMCWGECKVVTDCTAANGNYTIAMSALSVAHGTQEVVFTASTAIPCGRPCSGIVVTWNPGSSSPDKTPHP